MFIDLEQLLEWNPEIIIIDGNGYNILINHYATNSHFYSHLDAFKNHQVFMQMPFNFYSTNFEIALANAYFIGKSVYPEAFSDVNIEEKTNDISMFLLGVDISSYLQNDYYGGYQTIIFD
mgnify:CR=1 FL=1